MPSSISRARLDAEIKRRGLFEVVDAKGRKRPKGEGVFPKGSKRSASRKGSERRGKRSVDDIVSSAQTGRRRNNQTTDSNN